MQRIRKICVYLLLLTLLFMSTAYAHLPYDGQTPIDCGDHSVPAQIVKEAPKILIIGDSISIGYTYDLKDMLPKYTIYHNPCNAAHTRNGLKKIDFWLAQEQEWDVVVFNFGIWDANKFYKISLQEYGENLEKIARKIKAKSRHILFVTTTAVPVNSPDPLVNSEIAYNNTGIKIMKNLGIEAFDLHEVSSLIPYLHLNPEKQNDVHYLPEGYQVLASQIAMQILAILKR